MDRDELTIRAAGSEDVEPLLDLYQHLVPGDAHLAPEVGVAILESLLRFRGSAILVAEIAKALIGSCTIIVVPNLTRGGRPYGLVENVVTHAGFRNQGIGTALLNAATTAAWAADCYKLMLLTGSDNPATLRFYESAGFEASKTGFQKRRIPARPTS